MATTYVESWPGSTLATGVFRLRSMVVVIAGLIALGVSVSLFVSELSSPTHTAVSPENTPLATKLAILAGLGWSLIGFGIASRVAVRAQSSAIVVRQAVTAAVLGCLMGSLAWFVISFMFSS